MTIASGPRVQLGYVAEVTRGTTPSTPTLKTLRSIAKNVNLKKNTLGSQERRSNRQVSDLRHGFNRVDGSVGFELSLTAYDDMLEFAMASSWAAGVSMATANLQAVAASHKFVRATGSFITDGFQAGDIIVTSGFTAPANNDQFRVLSRTATDLVVAETGLIVDEASTSGRAIAVVGKKLGIGTTLSTFSLERQFQDIAKYQLFKGVAINTMDVNIQPEQIVGGSFGLIGMSASAPSGSSVSASPPTAAADNAPFSSFDGALYEGGVLIAIVTGINFSLNNGRVLAPVIGSQYSPDVFEGTAKVTGSMTAFFEDTSLIAKFVNETDSSLWLRLTDLDNDDSFHSIVMPRIVYSGGDIDPPQEGPCVLNMPFQSVVEDTVLQSLVWQRSNT